MLIKCYNRYNIAKKKKDTVERGKIKKSRKLETENKTNGKSKKKNENDDEENEDEGDNVMTVNLDGDGDDNEDNGHNSKTNQRVADEEKFKNRWAIIFY